MLFTPLFSLLLALPFAGTLADIVRIFPGNVLRSRPGRPAIAWAIVGLAGIAPLVLVSIAGLALDDPRARAQAVVAGTGAIVLALAVAVALRLLFAVLARPAHGHATADLRLASRSIWA
jgi:hypothetical protein